MNRIAIQSSNIKSIGYDAGTKTLEAEFTNGGLYQYTGVPSEEYAKLMAAESVGKYFGSNIRGKFPHTKVDTGITALEPRHG